MKDTDHALNEEQTELEQGPSGLGGWLILVAISIILSLFLLFITITTVNLPLINDKEAWHVLTDPSSSAYIPNFSYLAYYEAIGNSILLFVSAILIVLFFNKKSIFPKIFMGFLIANFIFILIDEITANYMFTKVDVLAELNEEVTYKETGKALISASIWVPYMIRSIRVKNTFVN